MITSPKIRRIFASYFSNEALTEAATQILIFSAIIFILLISRTHYLGLAEEILQDVFNVSSYTIRALQEPIFILQLLPIIPLIMFFPCLGWKKFEHGTSIRIIAGTITAILTWKFSLYSYNHYYGQAHYFDRLLVILTGFFVFLHLSAIGVFLHIHVTFFRSVNLRQTNKT